MRLFWICCCFVALLWAAAPDAAIERSLRARMARSKLRADAVKFVVKDGVVEWQGSVTVPQRKGAATRMAKAAGASRVVNRIVVQAPAGPAGNSAAPRRAVLHLPPRR